jgi:hypothetical protein
MVKCEDKSQQVQHPSSLALIEFPSNLKIFEVLVVSQDLYNVLHPATILHELKSLAA